MRAAARGAESLAARRQDARALGDAALARLVAGKTGDAAELLDRGLLLEPGSPTLLNDLAVTRLELFRRGHVAKDLVDALTAIERASETSAQDPALPFNRALILGQIGLRAQARQAWRRAAAIDGEEGWGREDRARLAELSRPTIAEQFVASKGTLLEAVHRGDTAAASDLAERFPHLVRELVQEEILPTWGRSVESGDEKAASEILRTATALAKALERRSGDPLLAETTAQLASATTDARRALARALVRYAEGRAWFERFDPDQAEPPLLEAERLLALWRSPFSAWASYHVAGCAFFRRDYEPAMWGSAGVLAQATTGHLTVVRGRALWLQGVIDLETGRASEASAAFREALALFEQAHELNYLAYVSSLLANSSRFLGEGSAAWDYRLRAIRTAADAGYVQRLPGLLGEAVRAASMEGHTLAALAFENEAIALLDERSDPVFVAENYWWLGMLLHRAGRDPEARRAVERGLRETERIRNPQMRALDEAGLMVTAGAVLRSSDPAAAAGDLTRALERHRRLGYRYLLLDIFLERGRAQLSLGNQTAARNDFHAAIEEYERSRRAIDNAQTRSLFFDQARDLFDEAVDLELRLDPSGRSALDLTERGRALTQLDGMASVASAVATSRPSPLRESLPPGTVLVVFWTLPDQTLAWAISRTDTALHRLPVGSAKLEALVARLRASILSDGDDRDIGQDGEALYDQLLRPLRVSLSGATSLVIVPDRALDGLPFAVLATRGKLLTDSTTTLVAPSIAIYRRALEAASRGSRVHSALAVGDPEIDRNRRDLPALPGAAREAARLAAAFPQAVLLQGPAATSARFLAELDKHDIVMFSGHAIADLGTAERSRLLFTPDLPGHPTGELLAGEIARQALSRPRLVVLAGCSTAEGSWGALEGSASLATPFLAAGAPLVLGTLWPVDDEVAGSFMDALIGELSRGADPGEAVAAAGRALRSSRDPRLRRPRAWAAFQLTGAIRPNLKGVLQ